MYRGYQAFVSLLRAWCDSTSLVPRVWENQNCRGSDRGVNRGLWKQWLWGDESGSSATEHGLMGQLMWDMPQPLSNRYWSAIDTGGRRAYGGDHKSRVMELINWKGGSWSHWALIYFTQQVFLEWLTLLDQVLNEMTGIVGNLHHPMYTCQVRGIEQQLGSGHPQRWALTTFPESHLWLVIISMLPHH